LPGLPDRGTILFETWRVENGLRCKKCNLRVQFETSFPVRNPMPRLSAKRARAAKPPEAERDDKYFSKVIGKAFDILRILRAAPQPLSLNELTLRVGLAKSSVFRMLHTLEVSGYAERDASGRYTASGGVRAWGREQLVEDLVDVAGPHMRALSREFGETVSLAVRFDNRIEVVSTIESRQLIRMGNIVGRILPPHASSLGKAITAFQPEERRESLIHSYGLHRFTTHTIVDERELKQELERVRRQGYSLDAEESALEGTCFGAPIRGGDGTVIGALSLSMPKMRLASEQHRKTIVSAIVRAAEEISASLGAPALAASNS
jgi:IclR family acetate operon transcriptional repressor